MAQLNTVTCDECGALKREANHWFKAIASKELHRFEICPFREELTGYPENGKRELDLCSESCAVKVMSRAMGAPRFSEIPVILPQSRTDEN